VTKRRIESAVRCGRITRLRRGVYIASDAIPDDPVALHVLRAQAEQVAAPARVASHATAALALQLPLLASDRVAHGPVHATRPAAGHERTRRSRELHIHLGVLPAHHTMTTESGLVVTTPARTALDLAAVLDLPEALMALDAALRHELAALAGSTDRRHYRDTRLCRAAERPVEEALSHLAARRAWSRLQEAVRLANIRRESPLESYSAGHMHLAGLPAPRLQARIQVPGGVVYPDFLWPDLMVVAEADGEGKYRDASAFAHEKIREGHLRDLGYEVVRWTGREGFGSPALVMERIRRALLAQGWVPESGPGQR
jgi:very-short-patch-repair endonuclease